MLGARTMQGKTIRNAIDYAKKRPVSLVLLVLSGLFAIQCIPSIGDGSRPQLVRDIVFVLFFPCSLILFVWKWRTFVALNTVALLILLGISVFLMVRYVDPLMGVCYVTVALVLVGLLLREYQRLRHAGVV